MKALRLLALAGLLASISVSGIACKDEGGDNDAAVVADGGVRADGGDATVVEADGGDAGEFPDAAEDAGIDAGQTFPGFIHDLINNHTNETGNPVDLPTPDLPDNEDPTNYDDLFP